MISRYDLHGKKQCVLVSLPKRFFYSYQVQDVTVNWKLIGSSFFA